MITDDQIIKAISTLNAEIYENTGIEYLFFRATFDGYESCVSFAGTPMWDSSNDERQYDEGADEWEDLTDFLRRRTSEEIAKMATIFTPRSKE